MPRKCLAALDEEIRQLTEAFSITYSPAARREGALRICRIIDERADSSTDATDYDHHKNLGSQWADVAAECRREAPPTKRPDRSVLNALEDRLWDGIHDT